MLEDHKIESVSAMDSAHAGIIKNAVMAEGVDMHGTYTARCYDKDGNLKWEDTIENLVTTEGKNDLLDKYLAGAAYTAAWYMGLISSTSYTTGPAVGDTMASHGGWAEDTTYSNGARPTTAWSSAAAGSKALSAALTFNINGTATIKGCFITTVSTKGGATGILFSAGLFSGGDKGPMASGDTLSVSYTASA